MRYIMAASMAAAMAAWYVYVGTLSLGYGVLVGWLVAEFIIT